jgi:transitional endoplasmic reticulum ATPase
MTNDAEPFVHLLERRDLSFLWFMRIVVRLCVGGRGLWADDSDTCRGRIIDHLDLHDVPMACADERTHFARRLARTLEAMEQQIHVYRLEPVLKANMQLLVQHLALSLLETHVLALAVLLRSDDLLHAVANRTRSSINFPRQLGQVLGEPEDAVSLAANRKSLLYRTGLVEFTSGNSLAANLSAKHGSLRRLASKPLSSVDELFAGFVRQASASELQADDFAHIHDTTTALHHLLGEALDNQRSGVNILLYGPPGTGKTQLARWLAGRVSATLYDVSPDAMSEHNEGEGERPHDRLAKAATCLHLLRGRRAMLAVDECDAIFEDASFAGVHSAASLAKAWVNDLLETSAIPMVWVANRIHAMDSAFVRRFDMVVRLDTPPLKQRLKLLERACGQQVAPAQLRRLAHADKATPAVLSRATSVAERVSAYGNEQDTGALIETILDGTLRAQGHPSVRMANRHAPAYDYDTQLSNASVDLGDLSEGLRRAGQGRILLYGPPGTGKTAFGHWLAGAMGRSLSLKRMSDIQSPWLGEMEQNLARAFEHALRDDAVLQIDEVDGFLRDRRQAERSWELAQVNEFLTQLESFEGIFIASTNLVDGLDPAAIRRFDHKVQVGYLKPEQAWELFQRKLASWGVMMMDAEACRLRLTTMTCLTPGDFSVIARRHVVMPYEDASAVVDALAEECTFKMPVARRIGFT